jgi:hypothetical protein
MDIDSKNADREKKYKILAVLLSVFFWLISYLLILMLTDFWSGQGVIPDRNNTVAIAIRDNVTSFQKWGTKNFTLGYLDRHYPLYWYFTESDQNDCKNQFQNTLIYALSHYPQVDLFLLAHHNQYVFWIESLPPELLENLHLVYNTGCSDIIQGNQWITLGADAYIGHYDQSYSPIFYFYFLRRWSSGYPAGQATVESNQLMEKFLNRINKFSWGMVKTRIIYTRSQATLIGNPRITLGGENQ